jgi:hypothetical protein
MAACKSSLQPFSFDVSVKAEDGRQDKIELTCEPFLIIDGDNEDVGQIKESLGVLRDDERSAYNSEEAYLEGGSRGWIFNRPSTLGNQPLKIRRAETKLAGSSRLLPPLFGGECRFRSWLPQQTSLGLRIELNPTRFARHQHAEGLGDRRSAREPRSALIFRQRPIKSAVAGEYPLDAPDSDNWIPTSPRFEKLKTNRGWNGLLKNYVRGVFRCIRAEIERAASVNFNAVSKPTDRSYRLRRVETYWEFSSPDPIKAVIDIYPLLKSFTEREVQRRHYPLVRRGEDLKQHHNSPVISVLVQGGVELVIYAKTNKRIRFEVRHNLDVKKTLNSAHPVVAVSSRGELFPLFDEVRTDAAKVLNNVFRHMHSKGSYPSESLSTGRFLLDFVRALDGLKGADALLSMLIHNDKIIMDENTREQVMALRQAGILEAVPRNNKRANVLTDKYRKAVSLLGIRGFSLRGARDRARPSDR